MDKRAISLLALAALPVVSQENICASALSTNYPTPVAADGWAFRLVVNGLTKPRGLVFDNDGGLLVVDSGEGLMHFALKDEGGTCLTVNRKTTLVKNQDFNHGIALSADGRDLYVSTSDKVMAWRYNGTSVTVSDNPRTVVKGMASGGHRTRTLLLSQKQPGVLLVSRGSDGNVDKETVDIKSGRSQLRSFNVSTLGDDSDGIDYTDGDVLGWGLRNSVGVAEHPSSGGVWSVENSVDQLKRQGKDIHEENPGEELNYHGTVEKPDGGNYGYPTCFAVWGTDDFPDLGSLKTGDNFAFDDAPKPANDSTCNEDYISPRLALPAHTAPLDIKFDQNGTVAYVSFHGSWNRDEPAGYRVASIAFEDGQPTAANDSMDAAVDVLTNADLSNCPDRCFRPAGLAFDSKQRLWFSSDSTGEVFVLEHGGDNSDTGGSGGGGGGQDSAGSRLGSRAGLDAAVGLILVAVSMFYLS